MGCVLVGAFCLDWLIPDYHPRSDDLLLLENQFGVVTEDRFKPPSRIELTLIGSIEFFVKPVLIALPWMVLIALPESIKAWLFKEQPETFHHISWKVFINSGIVAATMCGFCWLSASLTNVEVPGLALGVGIISAMCIVTIDSIRLCLAP